jgi:glycosyltransferase involved in cell wall biosynthesis
LIPYILNGFVKGINPLKLMEYYAVGLPTISSNLPNILDMPGPLYFADTHEEYGDHLDTILRLDLPELRRQAQEVARKNSWTARTESFMQFVREAT